MHPAHTKYGKRRRPRFPAPLRAIVACQLLACTWLAGCARGPAPTVTPATSPPKSITIAAASDLQIAFTEIAAAFERAHGCKVSLTFGSTGQLAQQIEQGLPVDIFAAANVSYIDGLREKKLIIPESQQLYARGPLVLVVHADVSETVKQLSDLRDSTIKHLSIANPAHAPYGVAARSALQRSNLWDELQPKIVLGENVRQALQYVETGNAEAGLVALSIAQGSSLTRIPIDPSMHDPIDQALAIIAGSPHADEARQFIAYLKGPDSQAIMKKCGFILPDEQESH
jgi:molybdate transport system substrate-binding protein